ncbi:MAG: hypothetical protein U1F49_08070 [Rubrivivax sp.]
MRSLRPTRPPPIWRGSKRSCTLQELAHVVARAQQLRQESVDLGLALLQTVAEWSAEAARQGVELHGPACSEPVMANPAALKHLLDLMVEHALQQGRAVRMQIELPADGGGVPRRRGEQRAGLAEPGARHAGLAGAAVVHARARPARRTRKRRAAARRRRVAARLSGPARQAGGPVRRRGP